MLFARHFANRNIAPGWLAPSDSGLVVGLGIFATVFVLALLAPTLSPHDPSVGWLRDRLMPPGSIGYWLGTDHLGRDVLSRVLSGIAWSLPCAAIATALAAAVGTALGVIAAAGKGWPRSVILQLVNAVLAFPGFVVAVCIIAATGPGFWQMVATLALLNWPLFARVAYAETRSLQTLDFVLAARLSGVRQSAILTGHILPALLPTLATVTAFQFADLLIAESALSFLGIGAPLGQPTWGVMLAESRQYLFNAPHLLLVPASAIVLLVVGANLAGYALQSRGRIQRGRR